MQNLFQFFARFGTTILFVFLEMVSFFLIIRYNTGQKDIFINSSGFYSGILLENYNKLGRYYRLSSVADSIAKDNARLRAELRFATIDASFKETPWWIQYISRDILTFQHWSWPIPSIR